VAVQKSMLEEKQSQQQTLVYEQRAQQASWSRRATNVKNPRRPGILHSARSAAAQRNAG
jgi:hypothetical protein